MVKIVVAEESNGMITATVRFDDGKDQTVVLPAWATKQNIKAEAKRLRDEAEDRESRKTKREDLVE